MSRNHVIYAGSFDPFTKGHLDIIERLQHTFEKITVLVSSSSDKTYWFSLKERRELVEISLQKKLPHVIVDAFEGLTVEYAKKNQIFTLARGLRSERDLPYEQELAFCNNKLCSQIETLFLFARPAYACISSRFVKEMAVHTGLLKDLIPEEIIERILIKAKVKNPL